MKYVKIITKVKKKIPKHKFFDIFEKYLFGEEFNKPSETNPEENTSKENRIWNILSSFLEGSWMHSKKPKKVLNAFKILKAAKPYYENLLNPKAKKLYRGLLLSRAESKKLLNMKSGKTVKSKAAPKKGLYVFNYNFIPRDEIQSWTESKKVASYFANETASGIEAGLMNNLEDDPDIPKNRLPIIFEAKNNNSFFMNPKLTNRAFGDVSGFGDEEEVLRIGKGIKGKLYIPKLFFDEFRNK